MNSGKATIRERVPAFPAHCTSIRRAPAAARARTAPEISTSRAWAAVPCRRQCTFRLVADEFDAEAMIERFRERAQAVRNRPLPPVAGPEKKRFLERAQVDYMDFAIIGDATATLEDGILTLRVDLRKS